MSEFFDPNEDDAGAELRGTVISGGGSLEQTMTSKPSFGRDSQPNAAAQTISFSDLGSNPQILTLGLVVLGVYLFRSSAQTQY